jgi:glycosyltransferase involved in cell wall biosynthesis
MKILMVSAFFPPIFGGASVQALTLSRALRKQGLQVEFLTNNLKNKSVIENYEGFKVHRVQTSEHFESKLSEFLFTIKILGYALTRRDVRILHFHSVRGLELFIFPILRLLGKRIVLKLTLMGSDDPLTFKRRKLLGPLYFAGLHFVNRFVAISKGLKDMAVEAGIPAGKVELIDNGLNIEKFFAADRDEKIRIREALVLKNFNKIFISIGQVEPRKGYDFLLQAWELITKSVDNAVLLIGGPNNNESNPFYCELQSFLKERNINNVVFLGKIENAPDYFRASDCFLFCSKAEGFGTVMIEAMSSRVPVVAVSIPGITEFILDDKDISDICNFRDAKDYADRVLSILKIDEARLEKASIRIREKYNIDSIARKYVEIYGKLLSNPGQIVL